MLQQDKVSDSEFYMWRAVFAFAFVDSGLSLEEQELLGSYLNKARFSKEQRTVLINDMQNPPDVLAMYSHVTATHDKERFCLLARALAWCEGDLDAQETKILKKVACFQSGDDYDILMKTRAHDHLHDFYKHYAKSGVVGLLSYPNQVEMRL